MGSDEFGHHLFPFDKVKWEKKGAQNVSSDLPDDKRQYTGDIVMNAAGAIVCILQIWKGKTSTSLPPLAVRERFDGTMMFDLSENHWANHDTKLRLLKRAWAWVVAKWAADKLAGEPRCIYLLDCWPPNLTERLKSEVAAACPGMTLRFIPAGATGSFQVNDTHLHFPMKAAARAAATNWRLGKIIMLRRARDVAVAGGADPKKCDESLSKEVQSLLKIRVMRAMAPGWLMAGCDVLLKTIEGEGRNLIRKGWEQLYLEPALAPGFIAAAYVSRREREAAATEADVQRRVAAAAAGGDAGASTGSAPHSPSELDALVEQVARLESSFHEAEVPTRQPRRQGTGKERKSRADDRARAGKISGGDGDADATLAGAAGGAGEGGEGSDPVLDGLSVKQLQSMCAAKDLAQYGTKSKLKERLRAWTPGAARSKRGRKGKAASGAPAKKVAILLADDEADEADEADMADEAEEAGEAEEADEAGSDEADEAEDESDNEQDAALLAEAVNGQS